MKQANFPFRFALTFALNSPASAARQTRIRGRLILGDLLYSVRLSLLLLENGVDASWGSVWGPNMCPVLGRFLAWRSQRQQWMSASPVGHTRVPSAPWAGLQQQWRVSFPLLSSPSCFLLSWGIPLVLQDFAQPQAGATHKHRVRGAPRDIPQPVGHQSQWINVSSSWDDSRLCSPVCHRVPCGTESQSPAALTHSLMHPALPFSLPALFVRFVMWASWEQGRINDLVRTYFPLVPVSGPAFGGT